MSRKSSADTTVPGEAGTQEDGSATTVGVENLVANLDDISDNTSVSAAHNEIREIKSLLATAHDRNLIDSGVRHLKPNDAAQALVGSVIFATPLLVEDGVFDIANYLFGFTVAGVPVFLVANTLFVVLMTYALLEWTGREKEETHFLVGVIPTRVVMVLVVSFVVAAVLMTVWGRVGDGHPPTEPLARINVVWTVGSLGAALGDILSAEGGSPTVAASEQSHHQSFEQGGEETEKHSTSDSLHTSEQLTDAALMDALYEQFHKLESLVTDPDLRADVQHIRERTAHAALDTVFGDRVQKYTSRDIAEAFVGSIFFSIPFLVEDGVFDVAAYFLSFTFGRFPVFFVVNIGFILLMVSALVYWAGPQDVQVSRPLFGVVPRRLLGITVVSFVTVAALMTMWGRVDNWQSPTIAVARITVVWTVASFGAALGDILPGESSGHDINDNLAGLGDRVGEFVD